MLAYLLGIFAGFAGFEVSWLFKECFFHQLEYYLDAGFFNQF
jgi:hypothetical protein